MLRHKHKHPLEIHLITQYYATYTILYLSFPFNIASMSAKMQRDLPHSFSWLQSLCAIISSLLMGILFVSSLMLLQMIL